MPLATAPCVIAAFGAAVGAVVTEAPSDVAEVSAVLDGSALTGVAVVDVFVAAMLAEAGATDFGAAAAFAVLVSTSRDRAHEDLPGGGLASFAISQTWTTGLSGVSEAAFLTISILKSESLNLFSAMFIFKVYLLDSMLTAFVFNSSAFLLASANFSATVFSCSSLSFFVSASSFFRILFVRIALATSLFAKKSLSCVSDSAERLGWFEVGCVEAGVDGATVTVAASAVVGGAC